jgi:hypothetical protein
MRPTRKREGLTAAFRLQKAIANADPTMEHERTRAYTRRLLPAIDARRSRGDRPPWADPERTVWLVMARRRRSTPDPGCCGIPFTNFRLAYSRARDRSLPVGDLHKLPSSASQPLRKAIYAQLSIRAGGRRGEGLWRAPLLLSGGFAEPGGEPAPH